jgi:DNA mismatch endonuclease (patch repair protein)
MSRIRGRNTTPEKRVRALLRRLGYTFRLHVKIPVASVYDRRTVRKRKSGGRRPPVQKRPTVNSQPAKRALRFIRPDIVLSEYKIAIFVHGCFWHRHRGCRNCTTPTHRRVWWVKKLEGNAARDKIHQRALRKLGWRPVVIWECETEKPGLLAKSVAPRFGRRRRS